MLIDICLTKPTESNDSEKRSVDIFISSRYIRRNCRDCNWLRTRKDDGGTGVPARAGDVSAGRARTPVAPSTRRYDARPLELRMRSARSRIVFLTVVLSIIGHVSLARAQEASSSPIKKSNGSSKQSPDSTPAAVSSVSTADNHPFWDRENILLFTGVVVFRGLDYASTRNFQARGRTEILLPEVVVNNSAAFAGVEAGGAATSVALSYLLHRTGHHKMERWLSISHISVTAFGVGWNYSLKSKHPR